METTNRPESVARTVMTSRQETKPWSAAMASAAGAALEFYDFFLYGPMAALVFGVVFFPKGNPALGTLLALATFAVGFLARPIGGIVIGHLGDRLGRRRMLLFTFLVTGLATVGIGLLPTYAQVGLLAPVLLVSLRFIQGFAIGGEWGGAALVAVEHSPHNRRGFFGSLVQAGAPVGVILSSGVVAILDAVMPRDALLAWGWRLPFLFSLALIVVGLIIRFRIAETPEFEVLRKTQKRSKAPGVEALRTYPKQILAMVAVHVSDSTVGFIQGVFIVGFATNVLGFGAAISLTANVLAAVANLIATPLAGALADRLGPRRVLLSLLTALCLFAFPMFWLIESRTTTALFFVMMIGGALSGAVFSLQASLFASVIPPRVRYSGMSIGFQVATVIGGGFGPLIAQGLRTWSGSTWSVSAYLVLVCVLAIIGALYLTSHQVQLRPASDDLTTEPEN